MVITHNMDAMHADRQAGLVKARQEKSSEKLSSGYSINRAADDAASLSISEQMRSKIRGLGQGAENIQDGVSLIQVADGALQEVEDMLQRMNELSVQAANGTNSDADREAIQGEVTELSTEITRIGDTTKFNETYIFRKPDDRLITEMVEGEPMQLVTSDPPECDYLRGAVQSKKTGKWYSAATLNFGNVTADNVSALDGASFTFYCSQNCNEAFCFIFKADGTASGVEGQNNGSNKHTYTIDISGCKNGKDVVDALYDYVKGNMPNHNSAGIGALGTESLLVSHSNDMTKTEDGKGLVIYENWWGMDTEEMAKEYYPRGSSNSGKIDATELLSVKVNNPQTIVIKTEEDGYNEIGIQHSSGVHDRSGIRVHRMNAGVLGIDGLDVSTEDAATAAIDAVAAAIKRISGDRSDMGAAQNRLGHSYNSNRITGENLQASESRIRDADMADEMVTYTMEGILAQADVSVLAQANQSQDGIMMLLR